MERNKNNNAFNSDSIKNFGTHYNWAGVSPYNEKKLAPSGLRLPTKNDWDTLVNYLINHGYNWNSTTTGNYINKVIAAKTDWIPYTEKWKIGYKMETNNSSGFTALPGGCRNLGTECDFFNIVCYGYWWSYSPDGLFYAYGWLLSDSNGGFMGISFKKKVRAHLYD